MYYDTDDCAGIAGFWDVVQHARFAETCRESELRTHLIRPLMV